MVSHPGFAARATHLSLCSPSPKYSQVDNPDYLGVWAPKKIPNPNFFTDDQPHAMAPIGGLGIELWTMQDGILFDNILIANDASVASALAAKTFVPRRAAEEVVKKAKARETELMGGDDSFLGKAKVAAKSAMYYAQDNPAIVGGSLCLGLLPIILFCCLGGKKKDEEEAEEPAAADAVEEEEVGCRVPGARGRSGASSPPPPTHCFALTT